MRHLVVVCCFPVVVFGLFLESHAQNWQWTPKNNNKQQQENNNEEIQWHLGLPEKEKRVMSKYRILFIYNVVLVAIMASGFIFSWPTFTGTIFPFLGVCFQFAMLLVLFVMILRFKRQRRMREAE